MFLIFRDFIAGILLMPVCCTSNMTMPYHAAEPIIGTTVRAIDRLEVLFGESKEKVGHANLSLHRHDMMEQGGPACMICKRPGHVAKDCLNCIHGERGRLQTLVHASLLPGAQVPKLQVQACKANNDTQ